MPPLHTQRELWAVPRHSVSPTNRAWGQAAAPPPRSARLTATTAPVSLLWSHVLGDQELPDVIPLPAASWPGPSWLILHHKPRASRRGEANLRLYSPLPQPPAAQFLLQHFQGVHAGQLRFWVRGMVLVTSTRFCLLNQ